MSRFLIFCAIACLHLSSGWGQTPQPKPLYPNGACESNGLDSSQTVINEEVAFGITTPDYYLFLPEKSQANGQVVIVCPGGGYGCVCYAREGIEVARWLNENGIAAVVLRYRMPNGHHKIPMQDVTATFELIRNHATTWNIDPSQIGIMGFSAGGHLAATAATQFESPLTRPAFAILIYPVITFQEPYTDSGTCKNLLGPSPTPELITQYSCELQVKPNTPPCFIALSDNDEVVPVKNSTLFYDALKANNIPAEMHIYPTGRHGWIDNFCYWDEYRISLSRWLRQQRERASHLESTSK